MIKVAIIDDHAVVRMGMKYVLSMDDEFVFAGEYSRGEGAADWLAKLKPDVVLLDIYMPDRNGLEVLREIREKLPSQKVLMLTTSVADNDAYEAMRLGALGYLLKDRDSADIYKAIRLVAGGAKYLPDAVRDLIRERQMTPTPSPREQDVLEELVRGGSNEAIAARLGISVSGVKNHLQSLFVKLGVNDRAEAVAAAIKRGFVK